MSTDPAVHIHECPACERKFACLKSCIYLYYRLCGECRDKRKEADARNS